MPGSGRTSDDDVIAALPKCELHIHVEGSLEPELLFSLAHRNSISLAYPSVEALRRAYSFTRLQDFLDLYYQGTSVLRSEEDFYDLAMTYLRRAQADSIRHVEMFFDPQAHTERGVPIATVFAGLGRAAAEAASQLGIEARLILCFLRHLTADDAERTLDAALAHRDQFIGVGLDSSEVGHPPTKFKQVFRRARESGLSLVAHAGEEGPPEYVWEAIDELGVDRVDHGNRAMEDPVLVKRLARDEIPLTVCPLSNLRLRVVRDLADHPLRRMLEQQLVVTVNSDDPAYFGGYLGANLRAMRDALGLNRAEAVTLLRNGWRASFLDGPEKTSALAAFDRRLAGQA